MEPAASSSARSLRRPTRLRPLRLPLSGRAQGTLEVVEHEARGGLRPGDGRDQPVSVADDEEAALGGRGLQLRELTLSHLLGCLEERPRRRGEPGSSLVGEGGGGKGAVPIEENCGFDLRGNLGQFGKCGLSLRHRRAKLTAEARRVWRNTARCRGAMVVPRQGRRERSGRFSLGATESDEGGPPAERNSARPLRDEGRPLQCCTSDWTSAASASTGRRCWPTVSGPRSARFRPIGTGWPSWCDDWAMAKACSP